MKQEEKKRIIIAGALFLGGVVMAVISLIILPDAVSMQFQGLQTGVPAFPKWLAVLIAFVFSTAFSMASVKYEEGIKYAFIGYGLHILYWICNL